MHLSTPLHQLEQTAAAVSLSSHSKAIREESQWKEGDKMDHFPLKSTEACLPES